MKTIYLCCESIQQQKMNTIIIRDESATGQLLHELAIELPGEEVTVREIIEARVLAEVDAYNRRVSRHYNGLVRPTQAEKTLNDFIWKKKAQVDPEKQVYVALDAFQKNGFFVLVDDVQVTSPEEIVSLRKDTVVSFIKLMPLVGG